MGKSQRSKGKPIKTVHYPFPVFFPNHLFLPKVVEVVITWEWEAFLGIYLPHKPKMRFQKTDGFSISNLIAILFPSSCINYLNQFLEEINDWTQKTKWVVDSFMGFPFNIWLYPIGSRVWIFFLPIPCEIMPPSLECCTDIVNCGYFD